jgi:hypothetical protein
MPKRKNPINKVKVKASSLELPENVTIIQQTAYEDIKLIDEIAQQYGQKWKRPMYEDIVAYGEIIESISEQDEESDWEFVADIETIWTAIIDDEQIFSLSYGYEVFSDLIDQYLIHKEFVKPKEDE